MIKQKTLKFMLSAIKVTPLPHHFLRKCQIEKSGAYCSIESIDLNKLPYR